MILQGGKPINSWFCRGVKHKLVKFWVKFISRAFHRLGEMVAPPTGSHENSFQVPKGWSREKRSSILTFFGLLQLSSIFLRQKTFPILYGTPQRRASYPCHGHKTSQSEGSSQSGEWVLPSEGEEVGPRETSASEDTREFRNQWTLSLRWFGSCRSVTRPW